MTRDRWRRIQTLFHEALDLPAERRAAFLDGACAGDPDLRRQVEDLMDADADPPSVLAASVEDLAAIALDEDAVPDTAERMEERRRVDRVGPYRIVREIGRGGMGTVYLGERDDGQFDHQVAVKLIHRDDASVIERFLSERQILASLQHPNIARLYDGGRTGDGRPYLVMEYVEGRPIDTYCDEQKLSIDARLKLFEKVFRAVQYAHQNLVVHRDLKPSNILIRGDGEVKLLDFGIAKLLENGASTPALTRTGMRVMTPEYAAPEQVCGLPVTTATDVYTLGLVLYEVLTGRRPYDVPSKSMAEAERAVTEARPERPSTVVGKTTERRRKDGTRETVLPEVLSAARATSVDRLKRRLRGDLDRILLMALRKEPERRYHSAEAFLEDIKRHLEGMPVRARPDTVGYRLRKFARRHAVPVAAGVLVLCSLVAGLGAALWQAEEARRERDTAQEVSTFLENLFTAADPYEASATERLDTLRIRDFLKRGAEMVQRDLAEQPTVQARLLATLGRVHSRLGLYDEALPLFEQAVRVQDALQGDDHPETLQSLTGLAGVFESKSEYETADSMYRHVLEGYRRHFGEEHERTASAMNNLALVLKAKGHFDEAEALHREAISINRRVLPEEDPEMAVNLNMLASLLIMRGNYDEAEPLYRESLAMRRSHFGDEHPSVAIALNNLGVLLRDASRYEEAEPLLREALEINRNAFGNEHPYIGDNLSALGSVLRNQGKYEAAEPVLLEAIAVDRKLNGDRHPSVSIALDTYAALLRVTGKLDEAERVELEAIDIAREAFGDDHYAVAITTSKLAGIVHAKGDHERAERLYREAVARMRNHFADDHPSVLYTEARRAQCLIDMGRHAEGETILLEAFRRFDDSRGREDGYTQRVLDLLVWLYEAQGRTEDAETYREMLSAE